MIATVTSIFGYGENFRLLRKMLFYLKAPDVIKELISHRRVKVRIRYLFDVIAVPPKLKETNICSLTTIGIEFRSYSHYRVLALYTLNSLWHGLEFGLFVSFFGLAIISQAARKVRAEDGDCYDDKCHFSDSLDSSREMRFNPHCVKLNQTSKNS